MKKLMSLMLIGVLALGLMTGCIGRPQDNFQEGKYNLVVAVQKEEGELEMMNMFKEAYEAKNSDVNIIVSDYKGSLFESYMSKYVMSEADLPMMMWMPDDQFDFYAAGGYFADLRKYYEQDEETAYSLYYESMLHAASFLGEFRPTTSYTGDYVSEQTGTEKSDSRQYGIYFAPRDYNQIAIIINKNLFNQFNVEIPDTTNGWTFDEYIELINEIGEKIKDGGNAHLAKRAANIFLPWQPVYTTVFNALGSDGIVKDQSFNLDSAANKQILEYLYQGIYDTRQNFDVNDAFSKGTVFMTTAARPLVTTFANTIKDRDGNIAIDFLPYPAEYVAAGCSGYGITSIHEKTEQTVNGVTKTVGEIAWDFIKFIISEEGQQLSGSTGFTQPILKSLTETGSWLQAIDASLNHNAFAQGKQLDQTTFDIFDPQCRAGLRSIMTTTFGAVQDINTGKLSTLETQTLPKYKSAFVDEVILYDGSKYE